MQVSPDAELTIIKAILAIEPAETAQTLTSEGALAIRRTLRCSDEHGAVILQGLEKHKLIKSASRPWVGPSTPDKWNRDTDGRHPRARRPRRRSVGLWPRFRFPILLCGRPRAWWWRYTSDTHNGYQTGWARVEQLLAIARPDGNWPRLLIRGLMQP
jgi:hypothetical protein